MSEGLYVQFGCGDCAPPQWQNFDISPRLRVQRLPILGRLVNHRFASNVRYGDIVKGLPIAAGRADGIYSSHVFEHIPRADVGKALKNCYDMLRSGGTFRLVVPDLETRARRYLSKIQDNQSDANDDFLHLCNLRLFRRPRSFRQFLTQYFGHSEHLWIPDYLSMESMLREAGFVSIRRCKLGDATSKMFALVEDPGRFTEHGMPELALEALKP